MSSYNNFLNTRRKKFKNLTNLYKDKKDVRKYWSQVGIHQLPQEEALKLKNKLIYENSWQTIIEALIESGNLHDGERILDAGCGWGRVILGLKKYLPNSHLVGLDITEKLLDKAQMLITEETGDAKSVEFIVSDIDSLPFGSGSFDKVISNRVLQYVPDPLKTISELKKVAKKNGRVIVGIPNKLNPFYTFKYHTKLYSPFEVKNWFKQLGFSDIKIKIIRFLPFAHHFKLGSKIMILEKIGQRTPLLKWIGAVILISGKV